MTNWKMDSRGVRLTSLDEILSLRHRVLRPDRARESAIFPEDNLPTTKIFALTAENHKNNESILACTATLMLAQPSPEKKQNILHALGLEDHPELGWVQLRAMASDERIRGSGLAAAMMGALFDAIKNEILESRESRKMKTVFWCNARTSAIGFYEKQKLLLIGDEFVIPEVGPHFLMAVAL